MIYGFEQVCLDMIATHKAKNSDYGSTWYLYEQFLGVKPSVGLMTRILDKVSRASNLMRIGNENRQVENEKLEDTLLDLAVYSIITLLQVRSEQEPIAQQPVEVFTETLSLNMEADPLKIYEDAQKIASQILANPENSVLTQEQVIEQTRAELVKLVPNQ